MQRSLGLCGCVIVGLAISIQPSDGQVVFRAESQLVAVYATVTEPDGRLVRGLTQKDFEIRDEGRPRDIVVFSDQPQPVALTMLLDRSGSVARQSVALTGAAEAFLDALNPDDVAAIGSLTWDCGPLTSDFGSLKSTLRNGMPSDVGSPLWESIDRAFLAMSGEQRRQAMLVLSDGYNSPGAGVPHNQAFRVGVQDPSRCQPPVIETGATREEVIQRADRNGVMVYAVGVESEAGQRDGQLRDLARQTGGKFFRLQSGLALGEVFSEIASELHQQYLIGFEPVARDGRSRRIEVRVRRSGMSVRARRSYTVGTPARASELARSPAPPPSEQEILNALAAGLAGRTTGTGCRISMPAVDAYYDVTVEGPLGRIMRAARDARRQGGRFQRADLTPYHSAPTVHVAAVGLALDAYNQDPSASQRGMREGAVHPMAVPPFADRPRIRAINDAPLVLKALAPTVAGYLTLPNESVLDLAEFRSLKAPVEIIVTAGSAEGRCRLSDQDLSRVR